MSNGALTVADKLSRTGSFYDRIADLYDLSFKVNGYGKSLELFFRRQPLPVFPHARILDAGAGTGLLTQTLLRAFRHPLEITALDLSASSIDKARKALNGKVAPDQKVNFVHGNILHLPFADNTFDAIVTSGALEYVPLNQGLSEMARVLKPGGHILHLPIYPSPMSAVLEVLFRFKMHSPEAIQNETESHFRIVTHHRFPPLHPIGWTKSALLAQKAEA